MLAILAPSAKIKPMVDSHPTIGICGGNADSASVRAMMAQISASGATPIFLGNHANRDAAEDIKKISALVVMGNNADIDPAKYGALKHPKTNIETDTARADYEDAIIMKALAQKMPLLGVCGGMQRLNVLAEGTLHQHVPDLVGHDEHAQQDFNIAPFIPVQPVIIDTESTLGKIGDGVTAVYTPGHGVVAENSMHHQAVDKVGDGLRAVAFSKDTLPNGSQLIEAIEADPNGPLKDQFVLGVQWHPEFGASALAPKIAARVVEEAQKFARDNGRAALSEEAVREQNIISALPVIKDPAAQPAALQPGSMAAMILSRRAQAGQSLSR